MAALDRVDAGSRAVVFGWPFADPALLAEVNDYVAAEAAESAGRLLGLAVVNPADPGARRELERCRDLGLRGLGEINADAQGFELEWEDGLRTCLATCSEMGWPALLHCSEPVGHSYPGKGAATPDRLWRLLQPLQEELPSLRLCLAHLGGGLPLYADMPEVEAVCRRLWFDTSALPHLYRAGALAAAAERVGRDRLCLGTDYPLLPPERYLPYLQAIAPGGEDLWLDEATKAWALG